MTKIDLFFVMYEYVSFKTQVTDGFGFIIKLLQYTKVLKVGDLKFYETCFEDRKLEIRPKQ